MTRAEGRQRVKIRLRTTTCVPDCARGPRAPAAMRNGNERGFPPARSQRARTTGKRAIPGIMGGYSVGCIFMQHSDAQSQARRKLDCQASPIFSFHLPDELRNHAASPPDCQMDAGILPADFPRGMPVETKLSHDRCLFRPASIDKALAFSKVMGAQAITA